MRGPLGKLSAKAERAAEPRLRALEEWVMGDPSRRGSRALSVLAPPFIAGFLLLAVADRSRQAPLWGLFGAFLGLVASRTLIDVRLRARRQPRPMCGCRDGELARAIPAGAPRWARLLVGWTFLAAAMLSARYSMAGAALCIWIGVSYLIAVRMKYVGSPEFGAIPTAVLGQPVSTGCSVWCRIDHALTGAHRERAAAPAPRRRS